jgi:hypothetical protein
MGRPSALRFARETRLKVDEAEEDGHDEHNQCRYARARCSEGYKHIDEEGDGKESDPLRFAFHVGHFCPDHTPRPQRNRKREFVLLIDDSPIAGGLSMFVGRRNRCVAAMAYHHGSPP